MKEVIEENKKVRRAISFALTAAMLISLNGIYLDSKETKIDDKYMELPNTETYSEESEYLPKKK